MSEIVQRLFVSPSSEEFSRYVKTNTGMPPIRTEKLGLTLHSGQERTGMNIPFTGEDTFVLRYRGRQGAFSSIQVTESDLEVLQLQGAKQEGLRIDVGLYWIALFADQILMIAQNPESGIKRVTMPIPVLIKGLDNALDAALNRQTLSTSMVKRYDVFAARAGMKKSDEERVFVRDLG